MRRALAVIAVLLVGSCGSGGGGGPGDLAFISHLPAHGEVAVPRNTPIRLFFSENVLPASIDDQAILVRIGATFQTRPMGSFRVTGNLVEFDPTATASGGNAMGFAAGEQILVKVPVKTAVDGLPNELFVHSVAGDVVTAASGGDSFSFVTGTGWTDPVPGSPGIQGLDFAPAPDQFGRVSADASVTVIFNEPIDPSTFALGRNIFLTNNTPAAGESIYQKDVPSLVYYDGSLTRYTLRPVFGFGQGPYVIRVGLVDPDAPAFLIDNPPADLAGNRLADSSFAQDFDTLEDPTASAYGVVTENFLTTVNRDLKFVEARWGDDPQFPRELVGQPITKRNQRVNIAAITGLGGMTSIDNVPFGPGEEDYCPSQNPLVGSDSILASPPASLGRRQQNLYRQAELGAHGTITRIAWGPDSDATFAATYAGVIIRLGHKRAGTDLSSASMPSQFDIDGFVTVVNKKDYAVPQAFDVNGGARNDGYLDWPKLELLYDYDGKNDLIVDIEAMMGNTYQTFRTFLAATGPCTCFNLASCVANNSIGVRQLDGTYGSDDPNPAFATQVVSVMEFEIASLLSDARSLYYDTGVADPDYISPIVMPLVQAGGASVALAWSASSDGVVEDVPFASNIDACDGHRHIRWHCRMSANLFTGARPRLELIQIPYVVP